MDSLNSITQTNEVKILQPIQCIALNDSLVAITCSAASGIVKGQVQIWNGKNLSFVKKYEFDFHDRWHYFIGDGYFDTN